LEDFLVEDLDQDGEPICTVAGVGVDQDDADDAAREEDDEEEAETEERDEEDA
jgi:ribosomal protein L12E/L44/L45/RPP1/RPP2